MKSFDVSQSRNASAARPRSPLFRAAILASLFLTAPLWRQVALHSAQHRPAAQAGKTEAVDFDPSFKTAPPNVQTITIAAIDRASKTHRAKLTIVFKKDSRLPQALPIRVGEKTVVLRRASKNSSRTFVGIVDFDFATFAAEQQRRAGLAKRGVKIIIFDQRRLVSEAPIEFVSPDATKSGILTVPAGALSGIPVDVDPARELLITDISVVNDPARTWDPCPNAAGGTGPSGTPMGVWTFGFLMTQMANQAATGIDPSDFAQNWVDSWATDQFINSFRVPARVRINDLVSRTWPKLPNGKLDLSKAPFRLLAIVNRVDLRQNLVYGGGGSAGQGRFVFGWVDPGTCSFPLPFTVILEYGLPIHTCFALRAYAREWANLASIPLGAPGFDDALQMITDQFSLAGQNPAKPNGSALDALRSNENDLDVPWEEREFHIMPGGQLQEATVAQTPDITFLATATLTDYINANEAAILAGTNIVPFLLRSRAFLGGSAPNQGTYWTGNPPVANNFARLDFSLSTCSGCHQGDTKLTNPFVHVAPRAPNSPARLSGFLTGETVSDPVDSVQQNTFNDLLRREQDLDSLLNSSCSAGGFLQGLTFKPINMPD